MSNKQEHNQKLKDLLKNASTEDAFEKEAMDGFAFLKDENEALELKKVLDARMYSEVFVKENPKNYRTYWLTAAVFIGIIGFTIYFIPNFFDNKEKEMAIHTNGENIKPEISKTEPTQPQQAETITQSVAVAKTSKQVSDKSVYKEKVNAPNMKQEEDLAAPLANMVPLKNQKIKTLEAEPNLTKDVSNAEDELPSSVAFSADDQSNQVNTMVQQPLALEEKSRNTDKKAASKTTMPVSSASSTKDASSSLGEVVTVRSGGAKIAASCSYKGGELKLKKELRTLLLKENLVKPFDVVLSLNKKAAVENVRFTNSFDLTETEKEKIVLILKSLTKFQVDGISDKREKIDYILVFKP